MDTQPLVDDRPRIATHFACPDRMKDRCAVLAAKCLYFLIAVGSTRWSVGGLRIIRHGRRGGQ